MVNTILGFIGSALLWLVAHLPNSPIQQMAFGVDGFGGGYTLARVMGWVNWLIPFNDMYLLLMAWLLAAMAFIAVKVFMKKVTMTTVGLYSFGSDIFD